MLYIKFWFEPMRMNARQRHQPYLFALTIMINKNFEFEENYHIIETD